MELDQLFAVKVFPTAVINIPCFRDERTHQSIHHTQDPAKSTAASSNPSADETEDAVACSSVSLVVGSSQAASTDFDLTGQVLWPVSVLLGHYLASYDVQTRLASTNAIVVELGAGGTGVPGLVTAAQGRTRQVVLTDGNQSVLPLLQENIDRQSFPDPKCKVSCHELVWGDRTQLLKMKQTLLGPVNMVVAADVVQWPSVLEPLLWTVQALLFRSITSYEDMHHSEDVQTETRSDGAFIVGLVCRASSTVDLFFSLSEQLGFSLRKIARTDYLQNGILPESCQKSAGPMDIYELKLLAKTGGSRDNLPFLLQVDDDEYDTTLGTSFKYSMSRPC